MLTSFPLRSQITTPIKVAKDTIIETNIAILQLRNIFPNLLIDVPIVCFVGMQSPFRGKITTTQQVKYYTIGLSERQRADQGHANRA
jgi:hypothetical protein